MLWENLKMAFISLRAAKLRSFLTMLGIIIGVGAVVAIIALGEGVKDSVKNEVSGLGSNILAISSGQLKSTKNGKSSFNVGGSVGSSTITMADIVSIRRAAHVTSASYISLVSGIVADGNNTAPDAITAATTPEYISIVSSLKLESGRFIKASDDSRNVIVLGSGVRDELFGQAVNPVGKTITLRGTTFTVIGVIAKQEGGLSVGPGSDTISYIPIGTVKPLTNSDPQIMRAIAQIDNSDNVKPTVATLTSAIKKNHGGQEDFSVLTQDDMLSTIDSILNLLTTFIVAIASISLLVGGIGIMNIMLVSVTERTREIGLRKAIGANNSTVLGQFLIEAIVISLIGGILGIGAALALAYGIGNAGGITPVFTVQAITLAVSISAAVGVVFGMAPAIQAARKRPIQALKSE
jgi:putative ABC transport system permease protein